MNAVEPLGCLRFKKVLRKLHLEGVEMSELKINIQNRKWLLDRLHAEIIGPDPALANEGVLELDEKCATLTLEQFYAPKRQTNGEEILWQDSPIKRYGAGVLYPAELTDEAQLAEEADSTDINDIEADDKGVEIDEMLEKAIENSASKSKVLADDSENYDVSLANSFKPSSMGLSFLADLNKIEECLCVEVNFAIYRKKTIEIVKEIGAPPSAKNEFSRTLWYRMPEYSENGQGPVITFSKEDLLSTCASPIRRWIPNYEQKLEVVVVVRECADNNGKDQHLITVSIINRQVKQTGKVDEQCFFQSGIKVRHGSSKPWIIAYPEVRRSNRDPDDEDEITRLLYRDRLTFAIGHGCAANWTGERPTFVSEVFSETLPTFETPTTSADLFDANGTPLRVSMRKLAGLDPEDNGNNELQALLQAYREWIESLDANQEGRTLTDGTVIPVPDDLKATARVLIERCRLCLNRIENGLKFLSSDRPEAEIAREAFKLTNLSMLIAQLRSSRETRNPVWTGNQLSWDSEIKNPDPRTPDEKRGYWRAFQIVFLLMSIKGICLPSKEKYEREMVDLIWFPTGGGKTEAYLGLTAFTIFFNRLAEREVAGADVIMRYTLRLLTAQQFQRAGLLFCAMEHVRKKDENLDRLGEKEFRLGMWVGGEASPNKRQGAKIALSRLQRDAKSENPFVLLKCPWCNAKFGPKESDNDKVSVYGYKKWKPLNGGSETIAFRCDDPQCEFGFSLMKPNAPPLPISIIDEDIIDQPPNLVIGTVDKFAMLTWKPETRAIFGIGNDGNHIGLPPSLIIQDELHLISGPLGSMVGAYETIIEELCTAEIDGEKIVPKIVASTATISRAEEQAQALYGRNNVMLFPPSGLEAGDSFFAKESREENNSLSPGRLYAGIMAPGLGSLQTTVARMFAALLQYPAVMPILNSEAERDPWWTLLSFFNSLRELGGAATLLVADTRDYLRVIIDRHGYDYKDIRKLYHVIELTSRIRGDHIPLAIRQLEKSVDKGANGYFNDAVEVCLASNIIEVGVDIDRLSLMTIIGQPKTTSQYIQVSSRVGRNLSSPGLDVVAFSQSKPRDRSHFERFRSFHQRLYAQVEPTSVTPFSPPAVDRALHGIIVAAARQLSPISEASDPRLRPLSKGTELRNRVEKLILRRVSFVDTEEQDNVKAMFLKRLNEWKAWNPNEYGGFGAPPTDAPLMHPAGSRMPPSWYGHSWPTLSSLRNVDANCEAEMTVAFNELIEESEDA
jgi:hypothetical protein